MKTLGWERDYTAFGELSIIAKVIIVGASKGINFNMLAIVVFYNDLSVRVLGCK